MLLIFSMFEKRVSMSGESSKGDRLLFSKGGKGLFYCVDVYMNESVCSSALNGGYFFVFLFST